MFHWSPKYFFTAVLLIIAASSAFVQGQFNNLCIRDPQQILESELVVKNTAVDRYYFLCNNVIFFIKPYDWTGKAYSSDTSLVRPLIFIYPNAHILCGLDGNVNNNCTMSGGTLQLEVVDANYFGLSSQKITNVSVQGVKFMNLGADATIPDSANVYIFGTPMGAELLVEDCVFQNNKAIANIKFDDNFNSKVTVVGSVFKNNTLVDSTVTRNSGLIYTDLGGAVVVNKSVFMDNTVNTSRAKSKWDGLHAVINANDISAQTQIISNIFVADSCFIRNKGISFSLVLGAIWGDGVLNSRDNYASSNQYLQQKQGDCGIGQLFMNIYYNYFGYYNLSTGICQKKFTASSCIPLASATVNVSTTGNTTTGSTTTPTAKAKGHHMNAALIFFLILILVVGLGYFFWRKRSLRRRTPTRL